MINSNGWLLALALLAAAPPALAQPVPPGAEGALAAVVALNHNEAACYVRAYDAAHLKQHPKQTVTQMLFRLRYVDHRKDRSDPVDQRNYYFTLAAKQRGRAKLLRADGECSPAAGGFRCIVECDGGGVDVTQDLSTKTLLIDLTGLGRIRMTQGCDEETEGVELTPGADDRSFRLSRADAKACAAIAKE